MSDNQHTPGPWVVKKPGIPVGRSKEGDRLIYNEQTKEHVAEVFQYRNDCHKDQDTSIANARLIAASPDLLAACEAVTKLDVCVRANGSGEWFNTETEQRHCAPLQMVQQLLDLLGCAEAAIAKAKGDSQ